MSPFILSAMSDIIMTITNKDTWSFREKNLLSTDSLLQDILIHRKDIEGVTILGGEPFDQYQETLQLVKLIQSNGLSVMLYTGYELEFIKSKGFGEILDYVDILIPGEYNEKKRNTNLQWRGSENQSILFLSERYKDYELEEGNYIEIEIDGSGKQTLFGYPDRWIQRD